MKFATILLAADREGNNPVAKAAGTPCKVLAPIHGKSLLERVLTALEACPTIGRIILCGPSEPIMQTIELPTAGHKPCEWIAPAQSPSLSAWKCTQHIDSDTPVLLTSADTAFPNPAVFSHFCHEVMAGKADVAVGLVPHGKVMQRFPGIRRTPLNFADGPFCTCNLFAFPTPEGRKIIRFWRRLEQQRKRPWKLIRELGVWPLMRYLTGTLTTAEVSRQVERKLGIKVAFVILPFAEAAVDVDTAEDLNFVRESSITGCGQ